MNGTYGTFFPFWVVVTHFLNIFFMLLLARSGLEVLSAFPKFYWNDGCPPRREWLRLSKKVFTPTPGARGALWTRKYPGHPW